MTVRVSKPAFNLRDKLSELDRPVGTHGSQLMRSHDAAESFDLVRAGRKNIIINGEHKIWQRGSSTTSPAGTGLIFGSDRWMFEEGCGQLVATVSRSADTPDGEGFQYSAQINVDTVESTISGDFAQYMYFVEGYDAAHLEWGTAHAKPATLSFWFKTTIAGHHYVTINSSGGVDTWSTVIHSPTNAWKKHVVTIDPPTSGTWLNDHRRGIEIRIGLCNSSSVAVSDWDKWYYGGGAYNGFSTAHSNLILTQNNKAWLTGVQLEEGNVATPFEFRSYGEELALCQRYFLVWPPRSGGIPAWPVYTGSSQASAHVWIPHTMRTTPTPTDKGTGTSTTTGWLYNNNGQGVTTRYANGSSPTLSCGGDTDNGNFGLNMHFGSYGSGGHEADIASWNGTSPGIFLNAEL